MRRCMRVIVAIAGFAVICGVPAAATTLNDYLPGPDVRIKFHFSNYDVGVLYSDLTPNKAYSGADLDALPWTDTGGAYRTAPYGVPLDGSGDPVWDVFGIARLDQLQLEDTGQVLWNLGDGDIEAYAMFWGVQDKYVVEDSFRNQTIKGDGMQLAMFEFTNGTAVDWQTLWQQGPTAIDISGPGYSTTKPGYAGITDNGGTLWLTASSELGGTLANPYEYYSAANQLSGNGAWWGDDPTSDNGWGAGLMNDQFKPYLFKNGIQTESKYLFTFGITASGESGWLVHSDDPMKAFGVTPELSSSTLMLFGMLPLGIGWWRRRRG